MYKSRFGKFGQIKFADEHEYYRFLGYLAKSDGSTKLVLEHNELQGAWARERRIEIFENMPYPFDVRLTAGNGSRRLRYRVNCNEFLDNLYLNHHFQDGKIQDIPAIRGTIPPQYMADFDAGLAL